MVLRLPLALSAMLAMLAALARGSSTPAAQQRGIVPGTFRDCIGCPQMVVVPAGSFIMGSPADEEGRRPQELTQREIRIRRFAVGKYSVTRAEWRRFVAATRRLATTGCVWTGRKGSDLDPRGSWSNLAFEQTDAHPVVCVSWKDAQDYVEWLSRKTGKRYRLLSEAEWEYAARAGKTTPYYWGTTASHEWANYGAESCCAGLARGRDRWIQTSPVGKFPANPFGLYDMSGNVLQWVQDCLSFSIEDLPKDGTAYEGNLILKGEGKFAWLTGKRACDHRVARGGDWGDPPALIRSAYRNFAPEPDYRSGGVGFRVARDI